MVRKSPIASMFAGSPVRPLQQHMEKVQTCIEELSPFFKAIIDNDRDEVAKIQKTIHKLETEADELKHELRMNLPTSLFMPMPREQILDLVTMQDKIANQAKDIAGVMTGRNMRIPESIADLFLAFVERSIDASAQAQVCVNELDELVEAGFRGREVKSVQKMIAKLDKIEYETDKLEMQIRHALFAIEKEYPPIDVMFLYRIIDWTGELADIAQRVGSRIQMLLAR
ncbi:MAG TPA: TIGR00153 family protein [Mariprofundaceae bacterium]|nr:TIGR00153 family protein [Mariprofundaceae bacterium]